MSSARVNSSREITQNATKPPTGFVPPHRRGLSQANNGVKVTRAASGFVPPHRRGLAHAMQKLKVAEPAAQAEELNSEYRIPTAAQIQYNSEIAEQDPKLAILSNPADRTLKVWEATLSSYRRSGSIAFQATLLGDETIHLPPLSIGNNASAASSLDIKVGFHSIKVNPSLRVEFMFNRGPESRKHQVFKGYIDWPFHPIKHLGGDMNIPMRNITVDMDEERTSLDISFDAGCAITSNLLPILHDTSLLQVSDGFSVQDLTDEDMSLLSALADVAESPNNRRVLVRFPIDPYETALILRGDTDTPMYKLSKILPSKRNNRPDAAFTGLRWYSYRRTLEKIFSDKNPSDTESVAELKEPVVAKDSSSTGKRSSRPETGPVQVEFDAMRPRYDVLQIWHPGTPIEPFLVFADEDEALVTLGYGAYLEYQETEMSANALRRNAHTVRICHVSGRVLALVDFTSPPKTGLPDDRFRLDDRTTVDLRIGDDCMGAENNPYIFTAKGMVVANQFDLPQSDLLILVTDKYSKYFKNLATPIESFHNGDFKNIPSAKVHVSPTSNKSSYKREVDSVLAAYGPGCSLDRLPFLLGDGRKLPAMSPMSCANIYDSGPAMAKLKGAKVWNKEQRRVIDMIPNAPGGAIIVTGPGGTGKTELIIHLIQFAIRCKQFAMVSGTRNDTIDDMAIKLDALDKTLRPVRFYAPGQEHLDLLFDAQAPAVCNPEHRVLVETFDSIQSDTKTIRRGLPNFSVLGRLMENLHRKGPLLRQFRPADARTTKTNRPKEDMRAYFRARIQLLRDRKYSDQSAWAEANAEEEREFIGQAYRFLRAEVVREAKVILNTNGLAASRDILTNFAVGGNVWVINDEGQSMTEAAALTPLSLNTSDTSSGPKRKIVMQLICGDLNQLPPFTVSRTGTNNTVNEFAQQRSVSLLERKIRSGFPAVELIQQRRAAEILMRPASMFHYGSRLQTPSYPALDPASSKLMDKLAGFSFGPHHSPDKRRMAWLQVNGVVHENKTTGSRANPANAAVVRKCLVEVRQTYGMDTNAKVMLATPYKRQKELYLAMAVDLVEKHGWSRKEIPRIVTIDSLIGREASMVILDVVNNGTEGFLREPRRACVTFTRAKDRLLVVGGSFPLPPSDKQMDPKILKDPVSGKAIPADMSRPMAFYNAWFRANGLVYPVDLSTVAQSPVPADLRPLGHDTEDEEIAADFVDSEGVKPKKEDSDWEFVESKKTSTKSECSGVKVGADGPMPRSQRNAL